MRCLLLSKRGWAELTIPVSSTMFSKMMFPVPLHLASSVHSSVNQNLGSPSSELFSPTSTKDFTCKSQSGIASPTPRPSPSSLASARLLTESCGCFHHSTPPTGPRLIIFVAPLLFKRPPSSDHCKFSFLPNFPC